MDGLDNSFDPDCTPEFTSPGNMADDELVDTSCPPRTLIKGTLKLFLNLLLLLFLTKSNLPRVPFPSDEDGGTGVRC